MLYHAVILIVWDTLNISIFGPNCALGALKEILMFVLHLE